MKQLHGGNIYAYEAAHGHPPLDFSANVSPLGIPEAARAAAMDALAAASRYPDPDCVALRSALAAHHGVDTRHILPGNGAADLIYRFTYAVRPEAALVCAPSFSEYAHSLACVSCDIRTHALREADAFRLTEDILDHLDGIQALYLCNPNNPTGQDIAPALLTGILDKCAEAGVYVLLDECFIDFLDRPNAHTRLADLRRMPRLVLLRAFTKLYAIPGLRLGYALCGNTALLDRMAAAGPPWSVSSIAQAAGIAALADKSYAEQTRALIQTERAFMREALRQMGISAIGEANFLLFQAAPGLADALLREGVLVRDCGSFEGLDSSWVRVAIRTRAENTRLLSRLSRCING